jgi:hypothetical protein
MTSDVRHLRTFSGAVAADESWLRRQPGSVNLGNAQTALGSQGTLDGSVLRMRQPVLRARVLARIRRVIDAHEVRWQRHQG